MIHVSKIFEMAKLHEEISLKWVAESGELVSVEHAIPTSFHGEGVTMNIKILPSGEFRKVNRYTVTEINGEEVIL